MGSMNCSLAAHRACSISSSSISGTLLKSAPRRLHSRTFLFSPVVRRRCGGRWRRPPVWPSWSFRLRSSRISRRTPSAHGSRRRTPATACQDASDRDPGGSDWPRGCMAPCGRDEAVHFKSPQHGSPRPLCCQYFSGRSRPSNSMCMPPPSRPVLWEWVRGGSMPSSSIRARTGQVVDVDHPQAGALVADPAFLPVRLPLPGAGPVRYLKRPSCPGRRPGCAGRSTCPAPATGRPGSAATPCGPGPSAPCPPRR